ncbi:MAG: hypothetical protein HKN92_04000 [Chitinophagales bacterium]|nr:hypothetical protein [Chitinophagales bacterium]
MDRRTFVKSGVGSLAISTVNPLEIADVIAPHWRNVSNAEMVQFFGQFDNAMLRTESPETSGIYVKELLKETLGQFDEDLFRGSMRSLLLSGNFGDLSVSGQMHPGVQKRLMYSAAEVDATMEGVLEELRSFSTEDCLELKTKLNQDPEFGDRILEVLDKEAQLVGTHKRRRKRLKSLGKKVIKQLKHSPEILINDSLKKCDTLLERFSTEEEIRKFMVVNMGKEEFEKKVKEAESAALRWKDLELELAEPQYNPTVILKDAGKDLSAVERERKHSLGLKLLGIAGIITTVGLLMIAIGSAAESFGLIMAGLVPGVTVGPILIITALIIILINREKKTK